MAMKDTTPSDEFAQMRRGQANTYTIGETVAIWKYGNIYPAKVVKVGKSTVTVNFTPKNGRNRDFTFPGQDVFHLIRHLDVPTGLL